MLFRSGEFSGLVIQALRHLGQLGVGAREIAVLRRRLTAADRRRLLKDARFAPAWVGRLMRDVAEPAKE